MVRNVDEVHQQVERRLQVVPLRYTKGRRQLVELLATSSRPVTIPELLEMQPRLTQSSLYRNMVDLELAGVVQKITGSHDRTRFELAEELIGHHHHSICTRCGAVDDFVVPSRAEQSLQEAIDQVLGGAGFRPTGHRIDVVGICANCT